MSIGSEEISPSEVIEHIVTGKPLGQICSSIGQMGKNKIADWMTPEFDVDRFNGWIWQAEDIAHSSMCEAFDLMIRLVDERRNCILILEPDDFDWYRRFDIHEIRRIPVKLDRDELSF